MGACVFGVHRMTIGKSLDISPAQYSEFLRVDVVATVCASNRTGSYFSLSPSLQFLLANAKFISSGLSFGLDVIHEIDLLLTRLG